MKECIFQEIKTAAGKKFLVSDSAIDSNERQCAYVYACVRAFKDTRTRVRVYACVRARLKRVRKGSPKRPFRTNVSSMVVSE